MEVRRPKRFVVEVPDKTPSLAQALYQEVTLFRRLTKRNPYLLRISHEEEFTLRCENDTFNGPLISFTTPNTLFGIPLIVSANPEPRFD